MMSKICQDAMMPEQFASIQSELSLPNSCHFAPFCMATAQSIDLSHQKHLNCQQLPHAQCASVGVRLGKPAPVGSVKPRVEPAFTVTTGNKKGGTKAWFSVAGEIAERIKMN